MILNRERLMKNPQAEYGAPKQVLQDPELSDEQKISLLMNWRVDLLELQRAEGENMQNASDSSGDIALELKSVTDALTALGADPATGRQD